MIIFGTKAKQIKLGEGDFFCPKCGAKRRYHHKKAQRYFSLYFVPIIPMGTLGEYLECQTCGTAFEMTVLEMKQQPVRRTLADLLNSIEADLKNGAPIEYVIRDLTHAGLDLTVAQKTVAPFLGENRHTCYNCGLTYVVDVQTCTICGDPLT